MNEDTDQKILTELRQLSLISRRVFFLLVLVLILSILSVLFQPSRSSSPPLSFDSVDKAMRQQDFPKALAEAHALVARAPSNYYGYTYLGAIELARGELTNAEAYYLRAFELFPNEENEKDLTAIRKRLASQSAMKLLSK
jgi:tetratricopeptide (TPR) repeat protein